MPRSSGFVILRNLHFAIERVAIERVSLHFAIERVAIERVSLEFSEARSKHRIEASHKPIEAA